MCHMSHLILDFVQLQKEAETSLVKMYFEMFDENVQPNTH